MTTEGPESLRGLARVLFEAPPIPVFLLDARLVVRDANEEASRLLACPRPLLLDAPLSRWLVPGEEGVSREVMGTASGERTRILRFRTARGRLRAREVRVHPDGSGGWVLVASELPEASAAGSEQAQRLAFLESLPRHFLVELAASGRIRYESGLDRIHLLGDGAALGEPFTMLLRDEVADREAFEGLLDTVRGGGVWRGTQWHRRQDGEPFLVRIFAAPRRDGESGRVEGIFVAGLDVERARQESERADRAERAGALGRLAGEVASVLHGELRDLAGEAEPVPPDRLASLAELAGDLSSFREVHGGRRRRLHTRTLLDRALGLETGQPGIRFELDLPDELPAVHSVGPAAEKVLTWTLQGLLESIAPGTATVRIAAAVRPESVVVSLQGEGARLHGEVLGSLFDVAPDGSRTLRLPLAHALAAAVGGRVWAWNGEEDEPTFLSIELPRFSEESLVSEGGGGGGDRDEQRRLILVVDDDASIRSPVRRFLEKAGYDVEEAWSGRSAMARISGGRRPHALVTDLRMLDGSGYWLLGELRRYFPDLLRRTVIVTGERPRSDQLAAELADCPVMRKPVELHALLDQIDRLVD